MRLAGAPCAALASAILLAGCNVFRSTEECTVSTDCPRGSTCTADKYCRTGGPIPVGVLLTLTGSQAANGEPRVLGTELGQWMLDRSPNTKVLGRGIRLVVKDTLGAVDRIPQVTSSLIQENPVAVLGPFSSAEVLAAQELTFARGLLHIGVEAGAAAVGDAQPGTLGNRYLFQLSPEIRNGIVRAIPLFLADPSHPPQYDACFEGMAVVTNDDTTGASFRSTMTDLMKVNCIPVTKSLSVPRDKKADYRAEVDELLAASHEGKPTRCLLMTVFQNVAGEILRTLDARQRETGRAPYAAFFGSGALHDPNFYDEAKSVRPGEPSLAEGFHGVDQDNEPPRAEYQDIQGLWSEFSSAKPALAGKSPRGETILWAEATLMVGLALEQAGRADSATALRDAFIEIAQPGTGELVVGPKDFDLAFARIRAARAEGKRAAIDYRGAVCDYDFDARGYIDAPTVIWRFKSGVMERVAGYPPAELVRAWQEPGPACRR